jgi:hypothetical protein
MYSCFPVLFFVLVFSLFASADVLHGDSNCSCGFYDSNTDQIFTDSIVVYFNESRNLPTEFVAEDYGHKYEKDWNAIYRQGADPANLQFRDSESLQLFVSPPTSDHLVNGAGIRTARRDIQYGSFRTLIKSPRRTSGGSAISMLWQYNETEVTELSVMNTNDPSKAWVGTFVSSEFTTRGIGVNFSTALNSSVANHDYTTLGGSLSNGSSDLWEYIEYRIDWSKEFINFYIAGNLSRSILHKDSEGMPSVPAPLFFKHWSTGNMYSMQGPPNTRSEANVGWIRLFFNSSTTTEDAKEYFATRCPISFACSMDDITLRGSTPSTDLATQKWKQKRNKSIKRMPALWISVFCISLSSFLLVHALIRRAPWRKHLEAEAHGNVGPESAEKVGIDFFETPEDALADQEISSTTCPVIRPPSSNYSYSPNDDLVIERATTPVISVWGGSTHAGPSRAGSVVLDSQAATPRILSPYSSDFNTTLEEILSPRHSQFRVSKDSMTNVAPPPERAIVVGADKIPMEIVTESVMPAPRMRPHPPPPQERVDYLAGLVAICAILVTVMHFGLTFVPAMVIPGAPTHYKSEYWAQQIISPFILSQMWLGVFFTTSVRFLVAGYLNDGDMQHIAKAAARRTPRLMIPVASIALLEYFLVDCGATKYLQYIPSLTWSNWPYVTRFPTIGHFISEVLELIYLVPNAVPQITFNYCTGVLWTIAVQLQGTWLVLCGVIIVYEMKSPWKRMLYYIFCLVNHWYAQSWGSYLWLGLLLTDLDITYKYKRYLHARPLAYYPLIMLCWFCVAVGFSVNLISNWTDFNFATHEHNIHPDTTNGEPLWNTSNAGYPAYYVPRLNGLLFAGGMQAIVELSPTVQYILSRPFLLFLFPHIFTIYLIHGLIFWSWGSWLMIVIADRGFGYGINVTAVGISSYVLLFAILPIITPVIEALGKDVTSLVWTTAIEKSPERRRTLFPFPDDLFKRCEEKIDLESVGSMKGESGRSLSSGKGKGKEKVEVNQVS